MSRGDRIYRLLLRAFPRDVRAEAGDVMTARLGEQRRAAEGRPLAVARIWIAAAHDALWHGLLQRAGIRQSLTTVSWSDIMRNVFGTVASFFSRETLTDARLAARRLLETPG